MEIIGSEATSVLHNAIPFPFALPEVGRWWGGRRLDASSFGSGAEQQQKLTTKIAYVLPSRNNVSEGSTPPCLVTRKHGPDCVDAWLASAATLQALQTGGLVRIGQVGMVVPAARRPLPSWRRHARLT